jgi:LMBR1 domain-containing protein 1
MMTDVANNAGNPACDRNAPKSNTYCGGIVFIQVWESLFCMVAFVVVVLIPFAIFYYGLEEFDLFEETTKVTERKRKMTQFFKAAAYEMVLVVTFFGMMIALYFTSDQTHVPVTQISATFEDLPVIKYATTPGTNPYQYIPQELTPAEFAFSGTSKISAITVSYSLNFAIYCTALFGWIGFWIFSFFAGAGLTALPLDLVLAFVWRPHRLSPDQLAKCESEMQERTNELLEVSVLLKRERAVFIHSKPSAGEKRSRLVTDRIDVNRLTQMIFILERDVEEYHACKAVGGSYNPLIPFAKLFFGVIFGFITMLWLIHIIVYMLVAPSASLFLNAYFFWFNTWFPIFGNVSYAMFSLYLLFCTISGCFKFGLRMLCFKIYPVKLGQTYMDSFLFNIALVMCCTVPVIHFCTLAFAAYTVDSDVYLIFGVQIAYLNFYSTFYAHKVFPYIILLVSIVTCIYLVRTPRDLAYSTEAFKETLLRRGASGYVAGDVKAAFSKEKKDGKDPKEDKARLADHTEEKKFKKKKKGKEDKKKKIEIEEKSEVVKEKGDTKATKKWVKKSKTKDSSI